MNTLRDKHDIFELIGSSHNAYHSAILTCYTFDPIFFNTYFLPNLRRCGITNIVVFVDAVRYDELMQQHLLYSEELCSMQYTVVRQKAKGNGAFHPKMIYLSGEDRAMMFVGSGNLTYSGYAVNQEVWSVFSLCGENSIYAPIIAKGWEYIRGIFSNNSQLVDIQLKWLEEQSLWMHKINIDKNSVVEIDDGMQYTMLYNSGDDNIFSQVISQLRLHSVRSIKIIAPFYDASGDFIRSLQRELTPETIHCVINKHGSYPYEILQTKQTSVKFYDWSNAYTDKASYTQLHGKLFQFETEGETFLLVGSANATNSAFGLTNGRFNDEVCIMIHAKHNVDYLAELGVVFNTPMTFDDAKSLGKPSHINNSSNQDYKVHIEAAEVIGNKLSIRLSHACKGCCVVVEQPGIKDIEQYPIQNSNCVINITIHQVIPGTIVSLMKDGECISNKVAVIIDDVVSRNNPNKRLRDIHSLLNSSYTWQNNIEELVSYMYFEDDIDYPSTAKHISISKPGKQQYKAISAEDFDKIEFKQKQQILNNPNVLIAEFLMTSVGSLRSLANSNDDIDNYDDIDSGSTKELSWKKHTEEPSDDLKYIRSVLRYVNKFVNNRLLPQLKGFNDGCKDGILGDVACQGVAINDFSHCAVVLILINDILLNKRATLEIEHYRKIRTAVITLVGSFSLLHRDSLIWDNSYRQLKMQDFANAILLYALNAISTFTWSGDDKMTEKLLVLNLLDLCRCNNSFCVEFLHKLQGKHTINADVNIHQLCQRYEQLVVGYLKFVNTKNSARIEKFGTYFKSGFIYKKKYGFLHIDYLHRAKDSLRVFATSHPAFDKPKDMKNGDNYVAVHI